MRKTIPCTVRPGAGLPAALAATLSLAASGCSLALDTNELDPLNTPDGYCRVLFDEYLRLVTSCHPSTRQWFDAQYGQMASMCDGLAVSKSRGAIVYDESAARYWIEKIRGASCTDIETVMYDTDSPFVGQVPDGGDCGDTIECADGRADCRSPYATCPGTCMAPGRLGDPCAAEYPECDVGYYCSSTGNGSAGTCMPATPVGGDCSVNTTSCGSGAYCYYCGSGCTTQYQCRSYVTEGGACNSPDKRCDPDAEPWILCDDLNSGTCKRPGSLVEGRFCRYDFECGAALFCGGGPVSARVCTRRLGYGSPCYDYECMPPLTCVGNGTGTAGACLPPKQVGDQCLGGSYDCLLGAYCSAPSVGTTGSCQPWPSAYDQPCAAVGSEWAPCLTGWCDTGGMSGPGVCRPFLPPRSSCSGSWDACGRSARCDWAIVGGSSGQVCVPNCLTQ